MSLKPSKRCLTLFIVWEMQSKTTMTYHFSHVRLAKIHKLTVHYTDKAAGKQTLSFITGRKTECYNYWGRRFRSIEHNYMGIHPYPMASLLGIYPEDTHPRIQNSIFT